MTRTPSAAMRVTPLERRDVPASFGNPWPDAKTLTLSFAPDGTDVGGVASTMQADLAASVGPDWKGEVFRAFQTWGAATNVNVALVADDGSALGAAAPPQGSPKFGDIRLASRPLAAGVLAAATPFDLLGGSWSGDVILNTATPWAKGTVAGRYDLATVLTHEAGHVFGLSGSADPADVMFEQYQGVRGLSAGDVGRIQGLYDGARKDDKFDAKESNGTASKAAELTFLTSFDPNSDPTLGDKPKVAAADLSGPGDVDWYKVKVQGGTFEVALRAAGLSTLLAKVSVYDAQMNLVASGTSLEIGSQDLTLAVGGAQGGTTYYVKVEAAPGAGVFAAGSYRLAVGFAAQAAAAKPPVATFMARDNWSNETVSKADDLAKLRSDGSPGWTYAARASVEATGDKDVYKVKGVGGSYGKILVSVFATSGALDPKLRLYDDHGGSLAYAVVSNDSHLMVLQVSGYDAKKDFYVEVSASNSGGTGNYLVGVDYRDQIEVPQVIGAGLLFEGSSEAGQSLALEQSRLVHFAVSAASFSSDAGVRLTIYDAGRGVVGSVVARSGQTSTLDLLLMPGVYTVRVAGGTRNGLPLWPTLFSLQALIRNDPLGPVAIDPGSEPSSTPPKYVPPPPGASQPPPANGSITVTVGPTTYYYVDPFAGVPLYSTQPLSQLWDDPFALPFF